MSGGNRSVPARALAAFREEGISGVRLRALDATLYRRLLISARALRDEDAAGAAPAPAALEMSFLDPGELGDYGEFRPEVSPGETRRRLDQGHRCVVARRDGAIVHARWISPERLESSYLGLSFDLPAGSVYIHDTFTAKGARRQGISLVVAPWYRRVLRGEGMQVMLGSTWPGNAPAREMLRASDQELIGSIGAIRLGSARIPVTRGMPPGHVGAARRFTPAS